MTAAPGQAVPLRPIAGFERTGYAWQGGRVVWAGRGAHSDHPRNAWAPWRPEARVCCAARLHASVQRHLWPRIGSTLPARGLLAWLAGRELAFALRGAAARFDAVREALARDDIDDFERAALRVLGLGPGLTPSGDDFIGGVLFALAQAPRRSWTARLPALKATLRGACARATNPISAALLSDLLDGIGYRALHELVAALDDEAPAAIDDAARRLLAVGATSGADLMAGLALALMPRPAPAGMRGAPCTPTTADFAA
jgi:hypothetical protein